MIVIVQSVKYFIFEQQSVIDCVYYIVQRFNVDSIRVINNFAISFQELLFQSACLELFVLRLAYRTNPDDTKLVFCNGIVLALEQCQRSFGDWLHGILEFCKTLHCLEVDISAFACLCALTLVTGQLHLAGIQSCFCFHLPKYSHINYIIE